MPEPDLIAAGREAIRRGAFSEARSQFQAALATRDSPEAEEGLSWAAWYLDDAETTFTARERAYGLYRRRGDRVGAARAAMWAAVDYLEFRGELAVAQGWLARARRLLDGLPVCAEHGWLALHEGAIAIELEGDTEAARRLGAHAARIGHSLGAIDVEMIGLALEGLALVAEADVQAGLHQLDEAAAAALAGDLDEPVSAGWACCYVIYACEHVRDHERAAQWCEEAKRLADRLGMRYLRTVCRTHVAGVLMGHGAWGDAEAELLETSEQLAATRPAQAAEGVVRLAELRRRQGRTDEARALFEEAAPHLTSTIGLAAIALDDGHAGEAADGIERALRMIPTTNRMARMQALEVLVQARAAVGDVEAARAALTELQQVTNGIPTPHVRAAERFCAASLASVTGDLGTAREAYEDAVSLFERSRSPYETARSRVELGRTLLGLGRRRVAKRELARASEAFERLGARREAARALAVLESTEAKRDGGGLTPREIEVLRLVAAGMSDRNIAAKLVLSEHTVHRHVANIRSKLRASSRAEAVAAASRDGIV